MNLTYLIIIIGAVIGILGIDLKPKNKTNIKPFYKRFNWKAYAIAGLFIVSAGLGILKDITDNQKLDLQTASLANQLKNIGYQLKSGKLSQIPQQKNSEIVKKGPRQPKEKFEDPIMDLLTTDYPNPGLLSTKKKDSVIFSIVIGSINNVDIYYPKDYFMIVSTDNGKLSFDGRIHLSYFNKSVIIKQKLYAQLPYSIQTSPSCKLAYYYFKVVYTNKQQSKKFYFRKIYAYTPESVGNDAKEVNDIEYNKVESFLKSQGVW